MKRNDAVIVVLPGDRLGGAEQFLKNMAVRFSRDDYSVHAVFLTRRRFHDWDEVGDDINLHFSSAGSEKWGLSHLIRKLHEISRGYRVRYTFSSNTHINSFLGLMRSARILKTEKLVVRESTTILTRFKGFKRFLFVMHYRMGYRFTDLVICQTGRMRDELWKHMPISRNWNVRVIRNPVDLKHINRLAREPLPEAVNEAGEFVVGAGRLIRIKGFDILIRSFSMIAPDRPGLNLVILGEGKQKANLIREAERLGVGDRVILPGHVDNPVIWFRHARLCVVSSLVEGFPNVLLQMMSQCDRVVSTTCAGGIEDIEGVAACSPGDAEALAGRMEERLGVEDTSGIRKLFDNFLDRNTVDKFVEKIVRECG